MKSVLGGAPLKVRRWTHQPLASHTSRNTGTKSHRDRLPTTSLTSHATMPPASIEVTLTRSQSTSTIFHSNQAIRASTFSVSDNLLNSRWCSIKSGLRFTAVFLLVNYASGAQVPRVPAGHHSAHTGCGRRRAGNGAKLGTGQRSLLRSC